VLWPPSEALKLYLDGDKSKVIDIDCADSDAFPRFAGAERHVADIEPGDVLFIPALWWRFYETRPKSCWTNIKS
jgi:tRNA wybutosine-synthesizing protein 5